MRIDRTKFVSALAQAGINQKELSARTGITTATITALKNGKWCSIVTVECLAAGLGVPSVDLLENDGHTLPATM